MTKPTKTTPYANRSSLLLSPVTFLAAVAAVVLLGLFGPALADAWLPKTGKAFDVQKDADVVAGDQRAPAPRDDPCDLIVGPAQDYCERGSGEQAEGGPSFDGTDALMIGPAVIGLGLVWAARRPR
ncbi:hypothetical protein [Streptomyces sp. 8N706]|uniref:hypothetical protein n=1 Tax=Streptomyces sp. 8N706 TaxID=3457416 RepID=UPI003FD4C43B